MQIKKPMAMENKTLFAVFHAVPVKILSFSIAREDAYHLVLYFAWFLHHKQCEDYQMPVEW